MEKKLTTGIIAPHFRTTDVFGRTIDLADYADKKVFLGFFRHAGCPFCNLRVHALTKVSEELKAAGLEMIFFFESKKEVILRSSFHQGVSPIPLISDPQKAWYAAYGLQPSATQSAISHLTSFVQTAWKAQRTGVPVHLMADGESIATMPAEFLIGKGLMIHKLLYSTRLTERLEMEEVRKFAITGTV